MSDIFEYRKRAHASYSTKYIKIELNWRKIAFYLLALSMFLGSILTLPIIYFTYFNVSADKNALSNLQADNGGVSDKIAKIEKEYSLFSGEINASQIDHIPVDPVAGVDDDAHDIEMDIFVKADDVAVHKDNSIKTALQDQATTDFQTSAENSRFATSETDGLSRVIQSVQLNVEKSLQEQNALESKYSGGEVSLENIPTIRPMLGGRISDIFGPRIDPFLRKTRHHGGLDFAAPTGTPIYAPAAGKVIYVRRRYVRNRGYGRCVKIDHGGGTVTLYGHMSKIKVEVGQHVKRWDVIGLVGDTGRSTGPHLHYEVSKNGKRIDPMQSFLY